MSATGATVLAKAQSEDAVKNHSLNKQLSSEAQHISNVLENCISQTQIVAALPDILHLNSSSSACCFVEEELRVALEKHQLLDERLEMLKGQESQGEGGEIRKRSRARLERDIKNSVRDLLRLFQAHPGALYHFRERGVEVGESEYKLISGLKMFHSHVVEVLLTSVEEGIQQVLCKQASASPAHYPEHMVPLEEDTATALKEIDAEILEKKSEIENLQHSHIQKADMSIAAPQSNTDIKTSDKQASLTSEIDQLNIQLNKLILENTGAERELREKCENVKTEIDCLLQKFDIEIQEHQNNLELNEKEYEREEEEFKRLEKPFSILEEECRQIQEKRRLAEEKRQKEMKELELKTKAAILAQAWWRGYSTRKALKNKGKNTKAKKGKGKRK